MKIMIVTGIFPPDCGGPATYIPILAEELSKRNHEIMVITLSEEPKLIKDNYPYKIFRIKRKQFKFARFIKMVFSIIKTGKHCDLIFANGIHFEPVISNMFLRKPLIHKFVGDYAWEKAQSMKWIHDTFEDFQKTKYSFKIELMKAIRTFAARRSQKIIVPSIFLKSIVEGWSIQENKISVVYNAAEENIKWQTNITVPLTTKYKLIYAGRLVRWKNIDKLIELLIDMPDCGLIIAGDGEEKLRLMQITEKLGITNRVYFAGYRNKEELYALMKQSQLFILFSNYEGLPHILLEAMNLGLPIICSDAGGTGELMKDRINCVLTEKNDLESLKKTVLQILSDKSFQNKLIEGGKKTVAQFTVKKMIDETENIFMEIVSINKKRNEK